MKIRDRKTLMFEVDYNIRILKIKERMLVLDGESKKSWEKRTERYRFELEKVREEKRLAIIKRKKITQVQRDRKVHKAIQYVKFTATSGTFLESMGLVLSYIEIQYKIDKKILLFILFLYNKKTIFTKQDIEAYAEMHNLSLTFRRIKELGYVNFLVDSRKGNSKNEMVILSSKFSSVCSKTYKMIIALEKKDATYFSSLAFDEKLTIEENLMKRILNFKTKRDADKKK